jgi:hypothetical protein
MSLPDRVQPLAPQAGSASWAPPFAVRAPTGETEPVGTLTRLGPDGGVVSGTNGMTISHGILP